MTDEPALANPSQRQVLKINISAFAKTTAHKSSEQEVEEMI